MMNDLSSVMSDCVTTVTSALDNLFTLCMTNLHVSAEDQNSLYATHACRFQQLSKNFAQLVNKAASIC